MATVASTNVAIGADISGYVKGTEEVKRRNRELRQSFMHTGDGARMLRRMGAPALSALSAGFSAASSAADGFNTSMAAVGASMLSAFAAGGPTGLAIAGIGTAIGLIIGETKKATREAEAYRKEIERTQVELDKTAERMREGVLRAQADLIEAQTMGRIKAADIVSAGMAEAERRSLERALSDAERVLSESMQAREAARLELVKISGRGALAAGLGFAPLTGNRYEQFEAAADTALAAARAVASARSNLERFGVGRSAIAEEKRTKDLLAGPWTPAVPTASAAGFLSRASGRSRIHEYVGVPSGGELPMSESQGDDMIDVLKRIESNTASPPAARAR